MKKEKEKKQKKRKKKKKMLALRSGVEYREAKVMTRRENRPNRALRPDQIPLTTPMA